jgi:thiamine-monophosphate kinase
VWTIDEQVDEVHFRRAHLSFEDIGYRATIAAASDLAAKGARPLGALASLVIPSDVDESSVDALARGQRQASDAVDARVVGGNLSRGERLSIATTWLGTAERPILRAGAKPGDGVYVCGDVGLAGAGFRALDAGLSDAPRAAIDAWRRPRERIAEGLRMARDASASIDISDGLAMDALHLAQASAVRVVLDEAALRSVLHAATLVVARTIGIDALDLALGGGEDYALLCTSRVPIDGFTRIGAIEGGDAACVLRTDRGDRAVSAGFDHFA